MTGVIRTSGSSPAPLGPSGHGYPGSTRPVLIEDGAAEGRVLAARIADDLADPAEVQRQSPPWWWRQSLASGALAVALLHVQLARTGHGPWDRAHRWLRLAADGPVDDGPGSNLHYGAPALGYVLHHAAAGTDHYQRALYALDDRVAALTRRRLDAAHRRRDSGLLPAPAEFDAIRGLAGLGAYWLHRHRARGEECAHLRDVLTYLVRLTEPLTHPGIDTPVPGWWSLLSPAGRASDAFPGGHANNGVAHGVSGPLALLALAAGAGVRVHGQTTAIGRIQSWLDLQRRTDGRRTWWPYWCTPSGLAADPASSAGTPGRPSWCYGTPGLARAQQLAARALGQNERQQDAESVLLSTAVDLEQAATISDASVCHGHAGLLLITHRAAADAGAPDLSRCVPALLDRVLRQDGRAPRRPWGLLEGAPGVALALTDDRPDVTGWDTCLLTS